MVHTAVYLYQGRGPLGVAELMFIASALEGGSTPYLDLRDVFGACSALLASAARDKDRCNELFSA